MRTPFEFIKQMICKHKKFVNIESTENGIHTIEKTCSSCQAVIYSHSTIQKGKTESFQ